MNIQLIYEFIVTLDSSVEILKELEWLHGELCKNYSKIEMGVYYSLLYQKLDKEQKEKQLMLFNAQALGTQKMDFQISFLGTKYNKNLATVIQSLQIAAQYYQIKLNEKDEALLLRFDELPDYIPDSMLAKLMDWTLSTISTMHSKGVLDSVKGQRLTPKEGLWRYLESKTSGTFQNAEEWFSEHVQGKKKKK